MREKDYTSIKKWTDDYDGAAIYSLVDFNGKRYIGQTTKLQQRLDAHRRELNRALVGKDSAEGQKLIDAVKSGVQFRVEILRKVKKNHATQNNMRLLEKHFVNKFGGYKKLYNMAVINQPSNKDKFYKPYYEKGEN